MEGISALFDKGPVVLFKWRNQEGWPVEEVSENVINLLGYTAEEIKDPSFEYGELIHADDLDRVASEVSDNSTPKTANFTHIPYRLITREGKIIWVNDHTHILRNDKGEITHYTGYLYDISEQVRTENELKAAQQKLQATLESIDNLIFVLDENGIYREFYSNEQSDSLYAKPEFFLGKHYSEVMPPDNVALIDEYLNLTSQTGEHQKFDYELNINDHVKSFRCKITPNAVDEGGVNKYTFLVSDITKDKESELKIKEFYQLFSRSNDLLAISDFEGKVEAINPRWSEVFGHEISEINTKGPLHFVHPDDKGEVYSALNSIRTNHSSLVEVDCRVITKSGAYIWLEWVANVDYDNQKVYSVARDITGVKADREKAERLSRGLFSLTQRSLLHDTSLRDFLLAVARETCDLLGLDRFTYWEVKKDSMKCIASYDREVNGPIQLPIIHMTDCPDYFKALRNQRIVSSPDPSNDPRFWELTKGYFTPHKIKSTMDASIIDEDGTRGVLCAETISYRRFWSSADEKDLSSLTEIVRNAINIDERKNTDAALRRSEQLLASLSNRFPGLVYLKEPDGKHLFANQAMLDYFGLTLEQYQNTTHQDLFKGEFANKLSADDLHCVETGETIYNELKDPLGGDRFFEEYKFPIKQKGDSTIIGGIVLDVTDRIKNRRELEESEAKYKMLVEFTSAVNWRLDIESQQFTYMDEQILELTGYPANEFKTMDDWKSKIHPEERELVAEYCSTKSANGENHEFFYRNVKPDGTIVWIKDSVTVLMSGDKPTSLVGYMSDITQEINAQKKLEASELRFRSLVNNIQVGILVQDANSKIILSNPRALELLDLTEQQLLGMSAYDPEWNVVKSDGSNFPNEEFPVPVAIREKRPVTGVIMGVFRPKRNDRVWLQVDVNPQIDDSGEVTEVVNTFVDITKRISAQQERNESLLNLQLAEQIAEIGYWSYDPITDQQVWSDQVYRIFEVSKDEYEPQYGGQSFRMLPEDFEELTSLRNAAINEGTPYSFEVKIKFSADRYKWVHIICETSKIEEETKYFSRGTIQDITSKKLAQEKLLQFTKLQTLLMDLSSDYINMPSELVNESVNNTLYRLGEFAGIDRAYIFRYVEDQSVSICTHSWIRPGIKPIDHNKPYEMTGLEAYLEVHNRGESYQIPDIELEPNENIKKNYKSYSVKSLITVPMLEEGHCIGCIGFDAVRTKRSFNPREVDLLKLFAELLVNLRQKVRYENSLKSKQKDLENALKEKDALFKELHHRIKNNLQLVSSLLYLKLENVANPELSGFINETIARILSISKIHDQLLRIEEVHELDIKDYLEELTQNIISTYSENPKLYPLQLNINQANFHIDDVLLIGLLINESVSNIIKHAYPKESGGPIEISLELSNKNQVDLTISDKGKGLPFDTLDKATESNGIQLIKVFTEQLKGTLSLALTQGTSYRVRFVKRR